MNDLVKKHTAFESMNQMINAKGGYRPSLRTQSTNGQEQKELIIIAECYNAIQEAKGDSRRAFES